LVLSWWNCTDGRTEIRIWESRTKTTVTHARGVRFAPVLLNFLNNLTVENKFLNFLNNFWA
jgi:hypothetical protein